MDNRKLRRSRVYVAGPITRGDQFANVRNGILAGNELADKGYAPYVPHLTCYWHAITPRAYESWTALDNEWIPLCDALLRIPGESPGADKEVELAVSLGIPVYYSMDDLLHNCPPTRYWGK